VQKFVDDIMAASLAIRQSKTILKRAGFVNQVPGGIRSHPARRNDSGAIL
jgi:hypothetical protein